MNNIDEMYPICHDCPYWEVCESPYICEATVEKMKNQIQLHADRKKKMMDKKAIEIVKTYILEHLDKSDPIPEFEVYTVWKCKTLQNWKYLLGSTLFDGMYYELTYNGDEREWYLDAYKKFENKVISYLSY